MKYIIAIAASLVLSATAFAGQQCGYVQGKYVCVNNTYSNGMFNGGTIRSGSNTYRYNSSTIGNNTQYRFNDGTRASCTTIGTITTCR